MSERYGNRRVPRLIAKVNRHRQLIANQADPELQNSWDEIENFIDFLYQEVGAKDSAERPPDFVEKDL